MATTYEPIATTTLGSATNPITFSSIPNTYTDLRVIFTTTSVSSSDWVRIRFNGDTNASTLYSNTYINGTGATATIDSSASANFSSLLLGYPSNVHPSLMTVDILSYSSSIFKPVLSSESMDANGSGTLRKFMFLYRNTSAISSLTISMDAGTFSTGSKATLYGIKAA